jgi:hypothetical protein
VAAGGPAGAVTEVLGVILLADENEAGASGAGDNDLRVAAQTKIVIALGEHFFVHRTMRFVADDATFAQGGVLEDEGAGLLLVTLRASLVIAGKSESARGFHDVQAMRVVALNAVHFALDDGMMLWEVELGLGFKVALETGGGVAAGIDDEFIATAPGGYVQAAGAVAGFATLLAREAGLIEMQARVRALRKNARDVGVAIRANTVADISSAIDGGRRHDGAGKSGTGIEDEKGKRGAQGQRRSGQQAKELHHRPPRASLIANTVIARL